MADFGHNKNRAMNLGSAAHKMLLEPSDFFNEYLLAPEQVRDKRGGDWRKVVEMAADLRKRPLLASELQTVMAMTTKVRAHPRAGLILSTGIQECSFFADDPVTGLRMKARPDWTVFDDPILNGTIIVDYKTVEAEHIGIISYSRHNYNMGRHVQGYHHKHVVELATGKKVAAIIHIVQMQEPPYLLRCLAMPSDWLERGRLEVERGMEKLQDCLRNGVFPGYPDTIEDMVLPGFTDFEVAEY